MDTLKTFGADAVMDRNNAIPKDSFDIVLDLLGGPRWPELPFRMASARSAFGRFFHFLTIFRSDIAAFLGPLINAPVFPTMSAFP
jgi:hypothetical protein